MLKHLLMVGLVMATVLISCDKTDLGNDYYFMTEYDAMDVGYPSSNFIYKAVGGKGFFSGSTYVVREIIPADVIQYNFNNNYIIVCQKFNIEKSKENLKMMEFSELDNKLYFRKHDLQDSSGKNKHEISLIDDSLKALDLKLDSIVRNDQYNQKMLKNDKNYYIIDKKLDKVFGPYNKQNFEKELKNRKINLKFE